MIEMLLRLKSALSSDAPHRKKVEAPLNLSALIVGCRSAEHNHLDETLHLLAEGRIGSLQDGEAGIDIRLQAAKFSAARRQSA